MTDVPQPSYGVTRTLSDDGVDSVGSVVTPSTPSRAREALRSYVREVAERKRLESSGNDLRQKLHSLVQLARITHGRPRKPVPFADDPMNKHIFASKSIQSAWASFRVRRFIFDGPDGNSAAVDSIPGVNVNSGNVRAESLEQAHRLFTQVVSQFLSEGMTMAQADAIDADALRSPAERSKLGSGAGGGGHTPSTISPRTLQRKPLIKGPLVARGLLDKIKGLEAIQSVIGHKEKRRSEATAGLHPLHPRWEEGILLCQLGNFIEMPLGETVVSMGERATSFFIVISGCVTINLPGEAASLTLKAGKEFGERDVFTVDRVRNADVIVTGDGPAVLLRMDKRRWSKAVKRLRCRRATSVAVVSDEVEPQSGIWAWRTPCIMQNNIYRQATAKVLRVWVTPSNLNTPVQMARRALEGCDGWNMKRPQFLVSVTGGADNSFDNWEPTKQKQLKTFLRHVVCEPAWRREGWVISGGTHAGCMKYLGLAAQKVNDHRKRPLPTIGISTLARVVNRDVFRVTAEATAQDQLLYTAPSEPPPGFTSLDPNHTHHLLVTERMSPGEPAGTDFGQELKFRSELEESLLQDHVPLVLVVINGGPNTLHTVYHAINAVRLVPIVIARRTGRCADALAEGFPLYNNRETNPRAWQQYVDDVRKKNRFEIVPKGSDASATISKLMEIFDDGLLHICDITRISESLRFKQFMLGVGVSQRSTKHISIGKVERFLLDPKREHAYGKLRLYCDACPPGTAAHKGHERHFYKLPNDSMFFEEEHIGFLEHKARLRATKLLITLSPGSSIYHENGDMECTVDRRARAIVSKLLSQIYLTARSLDAWVIGDGCDMGVDIDVEEGGEVSVIPSVAVVSLGRVRHRHLFHKLDSTLTEELHIDYTLSAKAQDVNQLHFDGPHEHGVGDNDCGPTVTLPSGPPPVVGSMLPMTSSSAITVPANDNSVHRGNAGRIADTRNTGDAVKRPPAIVPPPLIGSHVRSSSPPTSVTPQTVPLPGSVPIGNDANARPTTVASDLVSVPSVTASGKLRKKLRALPPRPGDRPSDTPSFPVPVTAAAPMPHVPPVLPDVIDKDRDVVAISNEYESRPLSESALSEPPRLTREHSAMSDSASIVSRVDGNRIANANVNANGADHGNRDAWQSGVAMQSDDMTHNSAYHDSNTGDSNAGDGPDGYNFYNGNTTPVDDDTWGARSTWGPSSAPMLRRGRLLDESSLYTPTHAMSSIQGSDLEDRQTAHYRSSNNGNDLGVDGDDDDAGEGSDKASFDQEAWEAGFIKREEEEESEGEGDSDSDRKGGAGQGNNGEGCVDGPHPKSCLHPMNRMFFLGDPPAGQMDDWELKYSDSIRRWFRQHNVPSVLFVFGGCKKTFDSAYLGIQQKGFSIVVFDHTGGAADYLAHAKRLKPVLLDAERRLLSDLGDYLTLLTRQMKKVPNKKFDNPHKGGILANADFSGSEGVRSGTQTQGHKETILEALLTCVRTLEDWGASKNDWSGCHHILVSLLSRLKGFERRYGKGDSCKGPHTYGGERARSPSNFVPIPTSGESYRGRGRRHTMDMLSETDREFLENLTRHLQKFEAFDWILAVRQSALSAINLATSPRHHVDDMVHCDDLREIVDKGNIYIYDVRNDYTEDDDSIDQLLRRVVLEAGDPLVQDNFGGTALMHAAKNGDVELAGRVLEDEDCLINAVYKKDVKQHVGKSRRSSLATWGQTISRLGADTSLVAGHTALLAALLHGNVDVALAIVVATNGSADLQRVLFTHDQSGTTPLMLAAKLGDRGLRVIEEMYEVSSLAGAIMEHNQRRIGHDPQLQYINQCNKDRHTALHFAIDTGSVSTVKWLLGHGAKAMHKPIDVHSEKEVDEEKEQSLLLSMREGVNSGLVQLLITLVVCADIFSVIWYAADKSRTVDNAEHQSLQRLIVSSIVVVIYVAEFALRIFAFSVRDEDTHKFRFGQLWWNFGDTSEKFDLVILVVSAIVLVTGLSMDQDSHLVQGVGAVSSGLRVLSRCTRDYRRLRAVVKVHSYKSVSPYAWALLLWREHNYTALRLMADSGHIETLAKRIGQDEDKAGGQDNGKAVDDKSVAGTELKTSNSSDAVNNIDEQLAIMAQQKIDVTRLVDKISKERSSVLYCKVATGKMLQSVSESLIGNFVSWKRSGECSNCGVSGIDLDGQSDEERRWYKFNTEKPEDGMIKRLAEWATDDERKRAKQALHVAERLLAVLGDNDSVSKARRSFAWGYVLKQAGSYLAYLFLLSCVSAIQVSDLGTGPFKHHQDMKALFLETKFFTSDKAGHLTSMAYMDISNRLDFKAFLLGPLSDAIYPTDIPDNWDQSVPYPAMGSNQVIGAVRIRQHRVTPSECEIMPAQVTLQTQGCTPDFSTYRMSTQPFGPDQKWTFDDNAGKARGRSDGYLLYPQGGFAVDLPSNNATAGVATLIGLVEDGFFDDYTSVVFIDLVYVNENMWRIAGVSLTIEFTAGGAATPIHDIITMMWPWSGFVLDYVISGLMLVIITCTVYFALLGEHRPGSRTLMWRANRNWKRRIVLAFSWWSFDFAWLFFGVVNLVTYGVWLDNSRRIFADPALIQDRLHPQQTSTSTMATVTTPHVDMDDLIFLSQSYEHSLAVFVILSWARLYRFVKYAPGAGLMLQALGFTILHRDVFFFLSFYFLVVSVWALTLHLAFGRATVNYAGMGASFLSVTRTLFGELDSTYLDEGTIGITNGFASLMFLMVLVLGNLIIFNAFIAVISKVYSEAVQATGMQVWDAQITSLMAQEEFSIVSAAAGEKDESSNLRRKRKWARGLLRVVLGKDGHLVYPTIGEAALAFTTPQWWLPQRLNDEHVQRSLNEMKTAEGLDREHAHDDNHHHKNPTSGNNAHVNHVGAKSSGTHGHGQGRATSTSSGQRYSSVSGMIAYQHR